MVDANANATRCESETTRVLSQPGRLGFPLSPLIARSRELVHGLQAFRVAASLFSPFFFFGSGTQSSVPGRARPPAPPPCAKLAKRNNDDPLLLPLQSAAYSPGWQVWWFAGGFECFGRLDGVGREGD